MSPVFSHGRLRLYLLRLLEESPRHGYEVIRLLEDQFLGLYAPSAGTIYPRLARLETEGLVTHHTDEAGRKIFAITDAGRAELDGRRDELAGLEAELRSSVRALASEIREDVQGNVRDVREELRHAARQIRREQRHANRTGHEPVGDWRDWAGGDWREWAGNWRESPGWWRDEPGAEGAGPRTEGVESGVRDLVAKIERVAARLPVTEQQLHDCLAVLDEASERIERILREPAGETARAGDV